MELRTGGDVGSLALAEAYARMLAHHDDGELVVRITEPLARIDLVPQDSTRWYEVPFDVSIVAAADALVLRHVPIRLVGRRVHLSGFVLEGISLQVIAAEEVRLERLALRARRSDPPSGAAVVRMDRPDASPRLLLRDCSLQSAAGGDDVTTLRAESPGPQLLEVVLDGCKLGPGARVSAEGAQSVILRGCRAADGAASARCYPGDVAIQAARTGTPSDSSASTR